MNTLIKHIVTSYIFILLVGTLFFVPSLFVSRFTTAPAVWMQVGIIVGTIGYVFAKKITLPPVGFILLITMWGLYHVLQNHGNIDKITTIITLMVSFYLFYAISPHLKLKQLFIVLAFLALVLSLWGLLQSINILPINIGSDTITGPFDNPAGISASLALLLPFLLYFCQYSKGKYPLYAIMVAGLVITVIVLSRARTAILAVVIILFFFFVHLLKRAKIKFHPLHYTISIMCLMLLFTGLFFLKKDSANGRLFIWQCTVQLIKNKPILGYGGNGFTANYMNVQASYFINNPESKYLMIADNTRYPFNEYLGWIVNYGIIGIGLTLLLFIIPLWIVRKQNSEEIFTIRLSLIAIGICALFSYPLKYPFIQLMLVLLSTFTLAAKPQICFTIKKNYFARGMIVLFSIGLSYVALYQVFCQRKWHEIAHRSILGETLNVLPQYAKLYTHLRHNDLFLYNYTAELNVVGHYEKSLQIGSECEKLIADYDLQLLMADNYLQMEEYDKAEGYLNKATAMCPVKFIPLYQLVELFRKIGQEQRAQELAQKILNKPVKIPSVTIDYIKMNVRNFLNDSNLLIEQIKSKESNINSSSSNLRQDLLLALRTPRALLPT